MFILLLYMCMCVVYVCIYACLSVWGLCVHEYMCVHKNVKA